MQTILLKINTQIMFFLVPFLDANQRRGNFIKKTNTFFERAVPRADDFRG
jgi:hypothetical protein